MANYTAPKCEHCGSRLRDVYTKELSDYSFDPNTGKYKRDAMSGSLEILCSHCEGDAYEVLGDLGSYQADATVRRQTRRGSAKTRGSGVSGSGLRGIRR
jgi:hypothetical protein